MWLTKDIHHLKPNFLPSIVYCLSASQIFFYKSCKLLDENLNCIALLLYHKYRFVSQEHLKYTIILIVLCKI